MTTDNYSIPLPFTIVESALQMSLIWWMNSCNSWHVVISLLRRWREISSM